MHVTDGLIGVPLQEGDVIVMAGMGGLNIIDIIINTFYIYYIFNYIFNFANK